MQASSTFTQLTQTDLLGISLISELTAITIVLSIVVNSIRFRLILIAFFTLVASQLYEKNPDARVLISTLLDTLVLLGTLILLALIFDRVLRLPIRWSKKRLSLRARLRGVMAPSEWTGDQSSITAKDYVKRWFVAATAATGCAVGSLVWQEGLWDVVKLAYNPLRLLALLGFTVVTIILVGPVEEYVLGAPVLVRDEHGAPKFGYYENFFQELWEHFTWRKLGAIWTPASVGTPA
jgi:hypothetical protein